MLMCLVDGLAQRSWLILKDYAALISGLERILRYTNASDVGGLEWN